MACKACCCMHAARYWPVDMLQALFHQPTLQHTSAHRPIAFVLRNLTHPTAVLLAPAAVLVWEALPCKILKP